MAQISKYKDNEVDVSGVSTSPNFRLLRLHQHGACVSFEELIFYSLWKAANQINLVPWVFHLPTPTAAENIGNKVFNQIIVYAITCTVT